ncbi:MAG TPA: M67 family metallopeptidase [Vicinamibacterales bacterium]|nr:M67 family metallopeptidase [Vicinamibacterales bacterium]
MLVVELDVLEAIRRHGAEAYPHECCGALIGRGDGTNAAALEALPLPNTTEEGPRRRFLVRPADYRAAERRAAERGAELLGFYHSHPDAPARPSAYDLEHAWPVFRYVIVSVAGGRPGEVTCWRLRDDRSGFDPEELSWRTRS